MFIVSHCYCAFADCIYENIKHYGSLDAVSMLPRILAVGRPAIRNESTTVITKTFKNTAMTYYFQIFSKPFNFAWMNTIIA